MSANICGGWHGAGLLPFDPVKVLRKVQPQSPPREITSPSPLPQTPFQQITSSPPDPVSLKIANALLLQQVNSGKPLQTPARKFVHRLTNACELFQAELTISQKQHHELLAVVNKRTERISAKRKSLEGQVIVSKLEFAELFAKQEQATKEHRKKCKVTNNMELTVHNEEPVHQESATRKYSFVDVYVSNNP